MVFPLGKITTLPPAQFLKFWETNILALGLGFESSVWVAFIARHGPAHSGSCWHGEIANFDFSGSSRGPGSVWTGQGECGCRQMPLSSQAASCTAPPGLEAHSRSITEPYAPMCPCWCQQGAQSLVWFHTEVLSTGKYLIWSVRLLV